MSGVNNQEARIFNSMQRVLIVQPALPGYRIGLFNNLQRLLPNSVVHILASSIDTNDVVSVRPTDTTFSYHISGQSVRFWGACWQPGVLLQVLRLKRSETLVLVGNPRYIVNLIAGLAAKLKGVDVIWWGQLWSVATSKRSLRIKVWLMSMVATKFLLYTKREAKTLSHLLPGKKIFFLNNGIDKAPIKGLRTPYKAERRSRRILFLGRLTPKAEIQLLLQAMAKVNDLTLDIVGGRSSPDLQQLIASLQLQDRVIFHGEISDESQIAVIANDSLFFVYPGSVGLSLIHAFNYGLPALLHNERRKHMPEIAAFKAGVHGETFSRRDHQSLAESITRMAKNREQLNIYSANALQVSEEDYNTDVMARRFADAIRAD